MLKLSDIHLDVDRLFDGNQMLADDPVPYYVYKDGQRTDNIEGYRYSVVLPNTKFEKVTVKVPGEMVELTKGQRVVFDDLEGKLFQDFKTKAVVPTFSASNIVGL